MSGPTTHVPLVYYSGDTILIDAVCTDEDDNVISLDGAEVEWMLGDASGTRIAYATLGNGISLADAANGRIMVTWPQQYPAGFYNDQLRVTDAGGIVATHLVGLIEIRSTIGIADNTMAIVEPHDNPTMSGTVV